MDVALRAQESPAPRTELRPEAVQARLSELNRHRLNPTLDDASPLALEDELALRRIEREFVETERARIAPLADSAPRDAEGFVAWFERLKEDGPGQGDRLFPWLAAHASLDQLRWFLTQEVAGEAGFEDLLALTQVKFPVQAKLEMARNFWDELGRGKEKGMHGPMLERLASAVDVDSATWPVVWESLALGNMMVALAANRCYAYQSIGALGAIELTAPGRARQVDKALRRLTFPGEVRRYFTLHSTLDVKHSEAWNREVLLSLVAAEPRAARAIAEGALLRLSAGARCFERYRRHFGI